MNIDRRIKKKRCVFVEDKKGRIKVDILLLFEYGEFYERRRYDVVKFKNSKENLVSIGGPTQRDNREMSSIISTVLIGTRIHMICLQSKVIENVMTKFLKV